jgi:hypothetical protein
VLVVVEAVLEVSAGLSALNNNYKNLIKKAEILFKLRLKNKHKIQNDFLFYTIEYAFCFRIKRKNHFVFINKKKTKNKVLLAFVNLFTFSFTVFLY